MNYYTVTFTAGGVKKQMGLKTHGDLESAEAIVKKQLENQALTIDKWKALPPEERARVEPPDFFGYSGKIENVKVVESERRAIPAGSPAKKLERFASQD